VVAAAADHRLLVLQVAQAVVEAVRQIALVILVEVELLDKVLLAVQAFILLEFKKLVAAVVAAVL
jgi:hypothetical protein